MKKYLFLVALPLILTGCGGSKPMLAVQSGAPDKPEVITRSLFDSKDRTISEEDIARLLDGMIRMPDTIRVAVLKIGGSSINRYYNAWWNDEEFLKTQQSFMDTISRRIALAGNVKQIFPVPSLLVPASPTITQLREAAVRLRADVLIVFSLSSDIYYKYKVFKKNEAKAFATCEAILLDVRTGVIPHSSVVTRDRLISKADEDFNDAETRKKAEREAITLTLQETGSRASAYLRGL